MWKTNFDRFLENYVAPVAFRPGPSHASPSSDLATSAAAAPGPSSAAAVRPISSSHPTPAPARAPSHEPFQRPPVEITTVRPQFEEYEMEVPPPLNLSDLPDSLSATLQVGVV